MVVFAKTLNTNLSKGLSYKRNESKQEEGNNENISLNDIRAHFLMTQQGKTDNRMVEC